MPLPVGGGAHLDEHFMRTMDECWARHWVVSKHLTCSTERVSDLYMSIVWWFWINRVCSSSPGRSSSSNKTQQPNIGNETFALKGSLSTWSKYLHSHLVPSASSSLLSFTTWNRMNILHGLQPEWQNRGFSHEQGWPQLEVPRKRHTDGPLQPSTMLHGFLKYGFKQWWKQCQCFCYCGWHKKLCWFQTYVNTIGRQSRSEDISKSKVALYPRLRLPIFSTSQVSQRKVHPLVRNHNIFLINWTFYLSALYIFNATSAIAI